MKSAKLLFILIMTVFFTDAICEESYKLSSPNEKILVTFTLSSAGDPVYSVSHTETMIL